MLLLQALLLDLLDLVEEVVRLLFQGSALIRALHHVGLAAVEQAEVGHGIIVVRPQRDGLLQVGDALVYE